jgi:hypothetical protein
MRSERGVVVGEPRFVFFVYVVVALCLFWYFPFLLALFLCFVWPLFLIVLLILRLFSFSHDECFPCSDDVSVSSPYS